MEAINTSSLLLIRYPQELLPGLVSVFSYRSSFNIDQNLPILLVFYPGGDFDDQKISNQYRVIKTMTAQFPQVKIVSLPDNQVSNSARVRVKTYFIKNYFSGKVFTDMHYSHDHSSNFMTQAFMQAFSLARRVSFGDAFGVFYSHAYFTSEFYPLKISTMLNSPMVFLRNVMARIKRILILPRKSKRLYAEFICKFTDVQCMNNLQQIMKYIPVDIQQFQLIFQKIGRSLSDMSEVQNYIKDINGKKVFIMLLGSFSESGLCSFASELEMYYEVATQYLHKDALLILKPHPSSSYEKAERIMTRLLSICDVVLMSNLLADVPSEYICKMLNTEAVLSYSFSSVSLTRLLNKQNVYHVLTTQLIKRYFPCYRQSWVEESNRLYLKQMVCTDKGVATCQKK